ncbi:hypothetical protein [Streptomyces sp. WAC05292]
MGPSASSITGQSVHVDGGRLLNWDADKQGDRPK